MRNFNITSESDIYMGIWEGENEADALISLFRDFGYTSEEVWREGENLKFKDSYYEDLCGDTNLWNVEEIE